MMEGETVSNEKSFAVNDIVFHRARNTSIVDLSIHVDGVYINTFSADGIIFCTPNGSTAYSLAAGGPIITPEIDAFLLTPICPHTISNRPIVLSSAKEIQVQYLSEHDPIEITVDGINHYSLKTGEVFRVRKSARPFNCVSLNRNDYFATLRTKLNWSGKLRHEA
jgi:NAD+ kinase